MTSIEMIRSLRDRRYRRQAALRRARGASRWTAWAARLGGRFLPQRGGSRPGFRFAAPLGRVSSAFAERWMQPIVEFTARLSWWNVSSSVFARTDATVTHAHDAPVSPPPSAGTRSMPAAAHRAVSSLPAISRALVSRSVVRSTHREFHSRLERQLTLRHESAVTRVGERLVHRSDRIERLSTFERTLAVRRDAAAAVNAVDSPFGPASPSAPRHDSRPAAAPPVAHPGMPAFTVEHLADQVIRQIDRRVIARRERMGRS